MLFKHLTVLWAIALLLGRQIYFIKDLGIAFVAASIPDWARMLSQDRLNR